jgi:hypothetical protein
MDGLAFWRANGWLSCVVAARDECGAGNGWLISFGLKNGGNGARPWGAGPNGPYR